MTMSDFGVQRAHDVDRQHREAQAENAARRATSFVTFETTGVGSIIIAQALRFDTTFLEKPSLSTGVELLRLPDRTIYELPHVTTGVMRWLMDEREYYIGAYVWARVWCDPVLNEATGDVKDPERVRVEAPKPKVRHHLVFAGEAYKKLPDDVAADLAAEL